MPRKGPPQRWTRPRRLTAWKNDAQRKAVMASLQAGPATGQGTPIGTHPATSMVWGSGRGRAFRRTSDARKALHLQNPLVQRASELQARGTAHLREQGYSAGGVAVTPGQALPAPIVRMSSPKLVTGGEPPKWTLGMKLAAAAGGATLLGAAGYAIASPKVAQLAGQYLRRIHSPLKVPRALLHRTGLETELGVAEQGRKANRLLQRTAARKIRDWTDAVTGYMPDARRLRGPVRATRVELGTALKEHQDNSLREWMADLPGKGEGESRYAYQPGLIDRLDRRFKHAMQRPLGWFGIHYDPDWMHRFGRHKLSHVPAFEETVAKDIRPRDRAFRDAPRFGASTYRSQDIPSTYRHRRKLHVPARLYGLEPRQYPSDQAERLKQELERALRDLGVKS